MNYYSLMPFVNLRLHYILKRIALRLIHFGHPPVTYFTLTTFLNWFLPENDTDPDSTNVKKLERDLARLIGDECLTAPLIAGDWDRTTLFAMTEKGRRMWLSGYYYYLFWDRLRKKAFDASLVIVNAIVAFGVIHAIYTKDGSKIESIEQRIRMIEQKQLEGQLPKKEPKKNVSLFDSTFWMPPF